MLSFPFISMSRMLALRLKYLSAVSDCGSRAPSGCTPTPTPPKILIAAFKIRVLFPLHPPLIKFASSEPRLALRKRYNWQSGVHVKFLIFGLSDSHGTNAVGRITSRGCLAIRGFPIGRMQLNRNAVTLACYSSFPTPCNISRVA